MIYTAHSPKCRQEWDDSDVPVECSLHVGYEPLKGTTNNLMVIDMLGTTREDCPYEVRSKSLPWVSEAASYDGRRRSDEYGWSPWRPIPSVSSPVAKRLRSGEETVPVDGNITLVEYRYKREEDGVVSDV